MRKTKFQRLTAALLVLACLIPCGVIPAFAETVASGNQSSVTDKTIADVQELLNAISYDSYCSTQAFKDTANASQAITISGLLFDPLNSLPLYREKTPTEADMGEGLTLTKKWYVSGNGTTTFGWYVDANGKVTTDKEKAVSYYSNDAKNTIWYLDEKGEKVEDINKAVALYTPGDGMVTWKFTASETAKFNIAIENLAVTGKTTDIERILRINGKVPFKEARYLTISKNYSYAYVNATVMVDSKKETDFLAAAEKAGMTVKADSGKDTSKAKCYVCTIPAAWTEAASDLISGEYGEIIRFVTTDIDSNEIRNPSEQNPKWSIYQVRDNSGYYADPFVFTVDKGECTVSLQGSNEAMAVKNIVLSPIEETKTYEAYLASLKDKTTEGATSVKIEAEYPSAVSSPTIYPTEDRSSALTSPVDTSRTMLNIIGGDKWETAGQYIEYSFKVESSGMYNIAARFRQNLLDGMFTCRSLALYSNGAAVGSDGYYNGIPFAECGSLQFDYNTEWQTTIFNSGYQYDENGNKISNDVTNLSFYFEAGVTYTMRLEVVLGSMSETVRQVEQILDAVNADYLNIIKLTGNNPDTYRDYDFSRVMPDTLVDMIQQHKKLDAIAARMTNAAGQKSSNVAILQKVSVLLNTMGTEEDKIAQNLTNLKSYIGSLGTFLSDAKTQPLELDYLLIQPASEKAPKANANFFQAFAHEVASFFASFSRNYDRVGTMEETEENDSVEVWLASARDQFQVIRNLINNEFTPNTSYPVDLKLVAGGTLLPSILSGSGPDVYVGLGQADVINYAIRGALLPIDKYYVDDKGNETDEAEKAESTITVDDFDKVASYYNEAAMIVLGIENAAGDYFYYALPETQSFPMLFVRTDILANLNIEIPKTWDDIYAAVPILQANNMAIGLTTDFKIFLYQMKGGDLFADDGMRINIDSKVALSAFDKMCNLFTMYSFPYQYDAANRFRTGEMPILIADYTGLYNQLKVFATEIEGSWEFIPLPGIIQEDGSIDNSSVSGVSAVVMVSGCKNRTAAWEYMKWHCGVSFQTQYSNEMVAILGPSAKHPTANREALASLPWTTAEYTEVALQFNNLASIPNYPGYYIIDRYLGFAFLSAYNDKADPATSLLSYVKTINKEITRKRSEFGLETLEVGQTLASKRMDEATELIKALNASDAASYEKVLTDTKNSIATGTAVSLREAVDSLKAADANLFGDIIVKLTQAANALDTY